MLFSRPFLEGESGWDVQIPTMREPVMFRLPALPEDEDDPVETVDTDIREQPIDFPYPDLIVAGTHCPPVGFEYDSVQMAKLVEKLQAAHPDIVYVASTVAWIFSSSISGSSCTLAAFTPRRLARSATCCADSSPVM